MRLPEHGANPHRLYESLAMETPAQLYDFSENVNAKGLPPRIKAIWPSLLETIIKYPDPLGEPFLSAVAEFHGFPENHFFIGNGAAEVLALLAERYRNKHAVIVHPTFSEYAATLREKASKIESVYMKESTQFQLPMTEIKEAMQRADVIYLCTPNNPTGILPPKAKLIELARYGLEVACEVVLDEAFIDFIGEKYSLISEMNNYPNVLILRSMTKMYAIPGLRLGYLIAQPSVIQQLKKFTPHWNVNGIAAQVGAYCLQESEFVVQTIEETAKERELMKAFLLEQHCHVAASQTNFLLFTYHHKELTTRLHRDLLARGIVLRHTESFPGLNGTWLRIGIKSPERMQFLREEMTRWFNIN